MYLGEQNRGVYWRKSIGSNECGCLGDGKHNQNSPKNSQKNGPKTIPKISIMNSLVQQYSNEQVANVHHGAPTGVSLRVHDSYSPNKCVPMPLNGPPGNPPSTASYYPPPPLH